MTGLAAVKPVNITFRMDPDIKRRAEALYGELGLNLSTAYNMFVRESLRVGGLPFQPKLSREERENEEARRETEEILRNPKAARRYTCKEFFDYIDEA